MPSCLHTRTRLVAKDKDAEYVECLDCGAVLEAEELPQKPVAPSQANPEPKSEKEKQGPEGPSETLSDA